MKKFKFQYLYLTLVLVILYLPIFYLVYYSFSSGTTMNNFAGFSLKHYQELFADKRLIVIVLNTLILALLSSLIATLIGTLGALFINRQNKRRQGILLSLNNILLVSPDVIIGASFLILFTFIGFSMGFFSVLLSHIAFSIPIVVLMILPRLKEMNPALLDAAKDLGANNSQVFQKVILPYITPSILSGFFMAMTYSLDDFAVTFFVTGNGFSTLSVEIYSRARQGISLEINALSTVMFLFALILVVIYYFISLHNGKKSKNHLPEVSR